MKAKLSVILVVAVLLPAESICTNLKQAIFSGLKR